MKFLTPITLGLCVLFTSTSALAVMDHSMHKGSGEKNDGSGCKEAKISRFKPAALSEVAPGAAFSFMVFDAYNPKNIEVRIKKAVVPITTEIKEAFVLVHGTLPETVKAATVRISVKVKGKTAKCNAEDGWLLKVTD